MIRPRALVLGFLALAFLVATGLGAAQTTKSASTSTTARAAASSSCQLDSAKGDIQHVIYLIFDNVHFLRDNPNVPSDLEQMPHLLNFIRSNGTLETNDHTVLISHTANGILTNLTGVYSDRHGQSVANSYRYFKTDGSTASSSSFKYWTDLTDDVNTPPTDPSYNMVTTGGKNAPAPWVPYTRAGCDWGATALANVVQENTGTGPAGDMTKVFGAPTPPVAASCPDATHREWCEAAASNAAASGSAARNLAQTDFVGMAIHCAQTASSICAGNASSRPDALPDEPGGYSDFKGLFGAKYVNPAICASEPQNCTDATVNGQLALKKLNGGPITDQFNQPGFPGFDGLFATTTLSYVAQMQEAGVPVTYGYISDAHDQHGVAGEIHATRGPGEADYVQQLKNYDEAFGQFFDRLKNDGITKDNTLFVFTVEEGDHFAGSAPTPAGCDGVTTPCHYGLIGEVNANLPGLMKQDGVSTPFGIHADMAPTIYLQGNPARGDGLTRTFGRTLAKLNRVNPYTGQPEDLTAAVADPVGMKALHMVTVDPQRTPTLTMFAAPDWFLFGSQPPTAPPDCNTTQCVTVPTTPATSTFAWNHGGIQPEIATTWLGMVGPGVRNMGYDTTWVDHSDVRPTMLSLLGLQDDYVHDGRVIAEPLEASAVPQTLRAHRETLLRLGAAYKQLNAPFGSFGMSVLKASTTAIKSGSSTDDSTYATIEGEISTLASARDDLAAKIRAALEGAAFSNQELNEQQAKTYIEQVESLLNQAAALGS